MGIDRGGRRRARRPRRRRHRPRAARVGCAAGNRHRRARPRARWRPGRGRCGAPGRRSRHREEHPPAQRDGPPRAHRPRALRERRGIAGADPAARRALVGAVAGASLARRHVGRGRAEGRRPAPAAGARGRLGADDARAAARRRAGQRVAGARGGGPARRMGEAHGYTYAAGRPRDQGRRHRWPPCPRAHGGHRAVLRGRPQPCLPAPARAQEPVRLHQRDRRLRDEELRAGRSAQPERSLPGGAPAGSLGQRRGRADDRQPARARRGAGARLHRGGWRVSAAHRHRSRRRPGGALDRGPGEEGGAGPVRPGHLRERRWRRLPGRAGRRSGGRCRAALQLSRRAARSPHAGAGRGGAGRGSAGGQPGGAAAGGGGPARLRTLRIAGEQRASVA